MNLLALAFGGFTSDKANAKLGEVILYGNRFAYRLNPSRFFFPLAQQILASLFLSVQTAEGSTSGIVEIYECSHNGNEL